jgi:hypothetical protein
MHLPNLDLPAAPVISSCRSIASLVIRIRVMTSRGEHYSARDQVPRAGTFDPATLILKANEKRINQKELVDLIIRTGSLFEQDKWRFYVPFDANGAVMGGMLAKNFNRRQL